jgi:hypothetical protein
MLSRLVRGLLFSAGEVGALSWINARPMVRGGTGLSLSELQFQMDYLGIPARAGSEAEPSEYF